MEFTYCFICDCLRKVRGLIVKYVVPFGLWELTLVENLPVIFEPLSIPQKLEEKAEYLSCNYEVGDYLGL